MGPWAHGSTWAHIPHEPKWTYISYNIFVNGSINIKGSIIDSIRGPMDPTPMYPTS